MRMRWSGPKRCAIDSAHIATTFPWALFKAITTGARQVFALLRKPRPLLERWELQWKPAVCTSAPSRLRTPRPFACSRYDLCQVETPTIDPVAEKAQESDANPDAVRRSV